MPRVDKNEGRHASALISLKAFVNSFVSRPPPRSTLPYPFGLIFLHHFVTPNAPNGLWVNRRTNLTGEWEYSIITFLTFHRSTQKSIEM